jgi:type II secretory pathway component PulM
MLAVWREWILAQRDELFIRLAALWERLRSLAAPYIDQARARYLKLERREKILVAAGGALLALGLVYELVYLPVTDLNSGIRDEIADRQRELSQVRGEVRAYLMLKNDLAEARKRTALETPDFSLFSVVEAALTQSVGRDKLGSITPAGDRKISDKLVEHSVQLQLTNLTLNQLVDALYSLRKVSVLRSVAALHVKRRQDDPHSFDVDMTCVAVGKNA